MLDLIGFWFNVSVYTVCALSIPFLLFSFLAKSAVKQITNDRWVAERVGDFFWEEDSMEVTLFNAISIPWVVSMLSLIACVFVWLGTAAAVFDHGHTVLSAASIFCTALAPYTSWLALVLISYFAFVFFGRKLWKLKLKMDKVLTKLGD